MLIRRGNDPLLYLERKAYLAALREGIAGPEDVRVVLAGARRRREADRRSGPDIFRVHP
jgi:hypothetical protein